MMVTCLGDIHIWSSKEHTVISDADVGCYTYHEKKETASPEHPYIEEKAQCTESRGIAWLAKNKKPDKVKDALKEVEELLMVHRCVRSRWVSRRVLQLVLSNGILVTAIISIHTGDLDRLHVDRSLVGKLSADNPSDALITDNYIAFTYPDKSKLDFIYFTKKPSVDASKKYDKLSSLDPKVTYLDLPGPVGRRLPRSLTGNLHQDLLLVWWPTLSEKAQPWAPFTGDQDRANIVIIGLNGSRAEVVSYSRTECNPLDISYSLLRPHQILTVEQSEAASGEMNVDSAVYEYNRGKIQKVSTATIPLKCVVISCSRDMSEDKLVMGCEDGSVVLYDEYKKSRVVAASCLIPNRVAWHPSGSVLLAANLRGDIQMFDMALNPLKFQKVAEEPGTKNTLEISPYFRSASAVSQLHWSPTIETSDFIIPECNDSIFIVFDRGPMTLVQFYVGVMRQGQLTPLSLVNQYIKYRQVDPAIAIMSGLNWNVEGQMCYACLSTIMNFLLRMPLDSTREGQLESTLGAFYAPPRPLTESTVMEFREPISRLARRFFHHLLRFSRFEKAFLLAVDIGARDLFMDIHYLAQDKGELALAEVARRKADQIDTESLGGDSLGTDEHSEESEESLEYSDEEEEEQPSRPMRRVYPQPAQVVHPMPPAPPQHGYAAAATDPRFLPQRPLEMEDPIIQQAYMAMPELALQNLEAELASELVDEYTAVLMDEPILPPPPSHADPPTAEGHEPVQPTGSTVKVIHFGMV